MGTVVQFKQTILKQADEEPQPRELGDYLSALAEKLKAIESCRSAIDKDVQVVQSILRSTRNPELRSRLLRQMRSMHDLLLLLSLNLLGAKLSIEKGLISSRN